MKLTVVTVKKSIKVQSTVDESKRALKLRSDEHKRSVRNSNCDKNEIAKHNWESDHNFKWDQKKVIDRVSRTVPRKIKENIHSLKNPNHISKCFLKYGFLICGGSY